MKIEVGMKCEQKAVIEEYGFNYVGHEFEITKVTDTVIMGKGLSLGGVFGIEREKFGEYFEIVQEVGQHVNEVLTKDDNKVIRNGMATIVILADGSKGVSKCLPEDEYDAELGYEIALTKAQIKSLSKKLRKLTR